MPAELSDMFRTLGKLAKLGLMLVGLATLLFVFLSYGWNGDPPTVELE